MNSSPQQLLDRLEAAMAATSTEVDAWQLHVVERSHEGVDLSASRLLPWRSVRHVELRAEAWRGGLRAVVGTSDLSSGGLEQLAQRMLVVLLEGAPGPRPEARPALSAGALASPEQALPAGGGQHLWSPSGEEARREWCHDASLAMLRRLSPDDLECHGRVGAGEALEAVVNSLGVRTWHRRSWYALRATAVDRGGLGTGCAVAREPAALRPQGVAEDAAARCRAGKGWELPPTGTGKVVLEPLASAALIELLARGTAESGGVGLAPPLRLRRFGLHPPENAPGRAADETGRAGTELSFGASGAATPYLGLAPSLEPPLPCWLEMTGGRMTVEGVLAQVRNGVWVSRLDRARLLPSAGTTRGPTLVAHTRGGSFHILGGRLGPRVAELTLQIQLSELPSALRAASSTRSAVPWGALGEGAVVAPTLLVEGVRLGA